MTERYEVPTEDREAKLERALMEEYLRGRQHTFADVLLLTEAERRLLMESAALYAARRLAEIGARAHYVGDLHKHE